MFRFSYLAALAVAATLVAGCGGTGSGTQATTTSTQSVALGRATLQFQGKLQSKAGINSGSTTVVGAAGANITEFNYNPAQSLSNSSILYTDSQGGLYVYTNGVRSNVLTTTTPVLNYCWTQYGQVVLTMLDPVTGYHQIYSCNIDGSGLTKITSNSEDHWNPSVAPGNTAIAYTNWKGSVSSSDIETCNFSGGNIQVLTTVGTVPLYSPNGRQVLFQGASGGLYLVPAAGGTAVEFDAGLTSGTINGFCWSQDSTDIAANINSNIYICDGANNGNYTQVQGDNGNLYSPAMGPDNKTIVYNDVDNTSVGGTFIESNYNGNNPVTLFTSNATFLARYPVWSGYLNSKSFAGPSGSFFTSAAGFLWGENGVAFSSLLCFTATTPSTATITPQNSDNGSASLIFDCHADTITGLKYTNNYNVPPVSLVPNVSDFLVSISSSTGTVTTIAPFAQAKPAAKLVGSVATYTGKFPAIYDAKGKNLAPSGATTLSLDTSTGKLLSWR